MLEKDEQEEQDNNQQDEDEPMFSPAFQEHTKEIEINKDDKK